MCVLVHTPIDQDESTRKTPKESAPAIKRHPGSRTLQSVSTTEMASDGLASMMSMKNFLLL